MKKVICIYKNGEERINEKCPKCGHDDMILKQPFENSETKEIVCRQCENKFLMNKIFRRKI
jgi:DNA-directed RNA polymerase subunit M/transcription elongation factor TFIIS